MSVAHYQNAARGAIGTDKLTEGGRIVIGRSCTLGLLILALCLSMASGAASAQEISLKTVADLTSLWTETFRIEEKELSSTGVNPYFVLQPGYQLILEGKEGQREVHLEITVLDETKMVDGVHTRVVEERESADGKLVEVSRNFFAISQRTNSVFYFGEDVEI